jgi:hypothetical protein
MPKTQPRGIVACHPDALALSATAKSLQVPPVNSKLMSLGADVVEGVISRFSNSENAMLQTDDGEEWNVGPLPASAEGERIRAKVIDGLWAVCVERPYANKEYLEEMRSRTDLSQQELQLFAQQILAKGMPAVLSLIQARDSHHLGTVTQ